MNLIADFGREIDSYKCTSNPVTAKFSIQFHTKLSNRCCPNFFGGILAIQRCFISNNTRIRS